MGLISKALSITGLVFLAHAYAIPIPPPHQSLWFTNTSPSVYSSYEHSLTHASPSATVESAYVLPTDIILETLFSTTLLCVGIVLGSPSLRPIEWRVWASEASLDDRRSPGKRQFESQGDGAMVGNPFRFLEDGERKGFLDVVGRRKEFAKWVREGSNSDAKIQS
jgi:hypothetical protein